MRRNPLYVFPDLGSVGIFEVPLKSTVHIIDYDGLGTPLFVQLIGKLGLNTASTIADLLADPSLYIDISRALENYSELEKITENGQTGWRILGRSPDNFALIGEEAIDLTFSNIITNDVGAAGNYSFTEGLRASATGEAAHAGGTDSVASGNNSVAFGEGTISKNNSSLSIGRYNRAISNDTLVEIGNGIANAPSNRSNALEIYNNGLSIAPSLTITDITNGGSKAFTTVEYLHTNSSLSELEKIQEGGNSGWRILGRDASNYGDIGQGSIDLSLSETPSFNYGAVGPNTVAMGKEVIASGLNAVVSGYRTQAEGANSTAEGNTTVADGADSHSEGFNTNSVGVGSHAEGSTTLSTGTFSHAEGAYTAALGDHSHAEGYNTTSTGTGSHTEGNNTVAANDFMHAGGTFNVGASGTTLVEIGVGTSDTNRLNGLEVYTDGTLTAPESTIPKIQARGNQTLITKEYVDVQVSGASQLEKITEGTNTGWVLLGRDPNNYANIGQGAIDLSFNNTASNTAGASGASSYAEGTSTTASGINSHAEGYKTIAQGTNSHAEGNSSLATGINSGASGEGTIAQNQSQTSFGRYNIGTETDTILEVGIGSNTTNRLNALTVYIDGTVTMPEASLAEIEARGDKTLITKEYVDVNINTASQLEKITEGTNTGWRLLGRDPDNYGDIGQDAIDLSFNNTASSVHGATGLRSLAEGHGTIAYGTSSHAEGRETMANGIHSHAEGFYTHAVGQVTHTEGYQTVANGDWSHAEGVQTRTDGPMAHAEGWQTRADGERSHAEGANTWAEEDHSHAEGTETRASGYSSHAEGLGTIALNEASHVAGKYNIGTALDTIHETGVGSDDANRANAFEIYTDGTLTAPESTPALIDARGGKALVTKEYVDGASAGASFTDNDFDAPNASGTPQTDFIILGQIFTEAIVYIDGIKQRQNTYGISDDGTDTTVELNTGLDAGEWVNIIVIN